ncbi:MAG: maleylacetate reductase [Solirubrobacteraceae bacterium]|jgi:alcohol dehydrogenase class IV|nr:maleylacetate reductase [Solirubrobacteraceae bacterium]
MAEDFRWQDGDRVIRFGRGALADAPDLLGEGYTLLTTERALAAAPALGEAAAAVHHVAPGRVDEVAEALRGKVGGELLVGLGGGRVVDVAKALAAAAGPPVRAAAVPTTLSAAEMTTLHRHAAGVDAATPRVRAAIVLNDPALSASQPAVELVASVANALAHAVEAPATVLAHPVATLAALDGARRLVAGVEAGEEPDRDELALGALLAGYASDSALYGLSHVMSQTLVRIGGAAHGPANAAVLPVAMAALEERLPERMLPVREAIGDAPERLRDRAGIAGIRDLGVDRAALAACADAAAERAELHLTPPPASRDELLALYEAAW